jgi:hypothetical protein
MLQKKVKRLFIVPALIINSMLTSMATAQASDLPRGYSQTCQNLGYDEETGELLARCQTIDGEYQHTFIELNKYITNDEGKLVWSREGNYIYSAGNCNITNSTDSLPGELTDLECDGVKSSNGEIWSVAIVLDEHIENVNGRLEYYE